MPEEVDQMIRWSPNTELASLHSAMDRLFEDFFGPVAGGDSRRLAPTHLLPIDVRDDEGGYEIDAAVPGFAPEEVEITVADGVLKIEAAKSSETSDERGGYLRREVAWGNFQRTVQLPRDAQGDQITATFENGMLKISVPKVPRPQPKKIQVTSAPKQLEDSAS
jgi:HSP20 family protein